MVIPPTQVPESSTDQIQLQQASKKTSAMPPAKPKPDEVGSHSEVDSHSEVASQSEVEFDSEDDLNEPFPQPPHSLVSSLQKQAENAVLQLLTKALDDVEAPARYCCGGRVLTTLSAESTASKNATTPISPPIILRWDNPTNDDISRRIRLPLAVGSSKGNSAAFSLLDNLLTACHPSGTLPGSQFSTDLDPHYLGILDVVAQILLPGFDTSLLQERPEHRGISAQLTHLQVFSSDSDVDKMFLPTLPENHYLGKLLVCLPNMHQGGQLEISNKGHSTIFDWSSARPADIQWAAFVGGCQHKLHPLQKGSQIVLVYDMRVTERVGSIFQNTGLADSTQFPIYERLRNILEHPGFMKEGGYLGFYCRHPYSHTSPDANKTLPYALKGLDLVLHNVCSSFGLKVEVRPIFDPLRLHEMEEEFYELDKKCWPSKPWDVGVYLRESTCAYTSEPDRNVRLPGYPNFPSFKDWKALGPEGDLIGTEFRGLRVRWTTENATWLRMKESEIQKAWNWDRYEDIKWLNTPTPERFEDPWELAVQTMPYTEECQDEVGYQEYYSHVVLLITIPETVERKLTVNAV